MKAHHFYFLLPNSISATALIELPMLTKKHKKENAKIRSSILIIIKKWWPAKRRISRAALIEIVAACIQSKKTRSHLSRCFILSSESRQNAIIITSSSDVRVLLWGGARASERGCGNSAAVMSSFGHSNVVVLPAARVRSCLVADSRNARATHVLS